MLLVSIVLFQIHRGMRIILICRYRADAAFKGKIILV